MNRVFLTPAAVALCGASSLSLAEPVSLADQVVTATRTAQTASQSLAAVSVIDREDIERSQARSVPELLRQVPGVSLANNGGFGKNTTLFLRGTESDHVLVLIDGIKVGSASAGLTAFQDLPVELIERIEVVRGPRSSLYGSEAIGGVIQIFTRRGDGQGAKPFFSAGYGTHQTLEGSAGVSGGAGNGWYSLGVSSFDTAGINTKRAGTAGYEPDR
ncbi:TonB-dependent receptor plug domain-containing protein, partial [Pseudomonas aeruginosa]|nr:TonB-dependent receptor plug domain-containing protein [Pseudomonas aeruginosa]